ncbi:hypothetical protein LguiB_007555 [Lonicera macranthoides]
MKQTLLLQNLYLGTRNLVYSPIFRPTLTLNNGKSKSLISPSSASASLLKLRFFTSKKDPSIENSTHSPHHHIDLSQTHNKDVPTGDDDDTRTELKIQIEKYLEGDEEAIPSIFEAILKRKLAGKHDESDDELMNEFRQKPLDGSSDREFDSESESD